MNRRPLISVIGDAGVAPGSAAYDAALDVGRLAVDAGFRVMTGGLGGVMEAASKGAHASARYRDGDTIGLLPGFDPAEANPWVDVAIATGLDHLRNGLVANADAIVAVGGGAGTLSEIALAWVLKRPVVALAVPGWSLELGGRRLDHRGRRDDGTEPQIFSSTDAQAAIAVIQEQLPRHPRRHNGVRPSGSTGSLT